MKILNTVRHRNIVGYCIRRNVGMILYDYILEGPLFKPLHERTPQVALDWTARHVIALGTAEGQLVPKITDFGMGKIVGDEDADATVSVVVGTLSYIASGKLTNIQDTHF